MSGLQKIEGVGRIEFTREQVDLIKSVCAKNATDDELKLFLYQASRTGLDPLARQIYFQKRRNRKTGEETMTILTAIDGYRLIADRTGLYAGNDDPIFDNEENVCRATVTVYKLIGGIRCPFTATARWHQYYPGDAQGFMWQKMPHLMLGKCAEALALRKAFPAELSGVYTEDEMAQAGRDSDLTAVYVDATAVEAPKRSEKATSAHDAAQRSLEADINRPLPPGVYNDRDLVMTTELADFLARQEVPERFWEEIGKKLHGRPKSDCKAVIEEVRRAPV